MSSLRNSIPRRAHKERAQAQARKKFGLLEKHKDYVERAKAYHKKEAIIQKLKEKASFKNPDEFYHKMINTKTVNGVHKPEFLALGNVRSIVRSCKTRNTVTYSRAPLCEPGLFTHQYRPYSNWNYSYSYGGRPNKSLLFELRKGFNSGFPKNYSVSIQTNTVAHHARLAWKNFYQKHALNVRSYIPIRPTNTLAHHARLAWKNFYQRHALNSRSRITINKAAQAFSLAFTRSYLVVPGILALTYGAKGAFAKASQPDVFLPSSSLYMRAQEGHHFVVSLILSVFEGLVLLLRACYLAILFSPSIAMAPFADSFGPEFRKYWLHIIHQTLERAGPAFIKWGQWAASRPDLFPRDLCEELSKLHTKAPEHSFAYTRKTIEKAFGRKIEEIFEDFEEVPVASGSIAQVHRATLKYRYRGRQIKPMVVAVKVRHPGVGESIKRDFEIINIAARISKVIPAVKWLRLDESVQQFAVFMMSQVDLAREAAHLSRFIYNFRRSKDVSFPRPLYPLVHPAVLVETFEQGENVSHYFDEVKGQERLKSNLAHIGTHALLKMLLVDNFIHADMHPGNILVRVAQNKPKKRLFKSKPHVIFLDVGMTAELSKSDRSNLLAFFKAVARRDGRTAAESTLKLSKKQNCPDPEAFIQEVKESFDYWGTPEGDLIHPADCMHQLLEKVRRHKVNIDGNVCTVMVTTLVLEGWQRKLDPDYDIMHTLQTMLLKSDWAESLSHTIERLMAP